MEVGHGRASVVEVEWRMVWIENSVPALCSSEDIVEGSCVYLLEVHEGLLAAHLQFYTTNVYN